MAFTLPNNDASGIAGNPQAIWMQADIDAVVAGISGLTGVISGCAVTAQGSPNMTVAVASGSVKIAGSTVAVSSGNVTITTADATNPRVDLIVVNGSGTKSATAGTAAANPGAPPIPASSALFAMVYVPATATTITTARIVDKRVILSASGSVSGTNTGDQNTFTSIVKSGETTVTAASTTQALTFVASTGMTITTDNTAKSVTFASSGGGGGSGDMLGALINAINAIVDTNATLVANTWNTVKATAARSETLPSPATSKVIGIQITWDSTNLVTILPNASEKIDNASSRVMWKGESAVLISDGTNWFKVAGKSIPMECHMSLASGQAVATGGSGSQILLDTTNTDNTGLMADPTTNRQITIKRAGKYAIASYGYFAGIDAAVTLGQMFVTIAGTGVSFVALNNGVVNAYVGFTACDPNKTMAAADTVRQAMYQNSGNNQTSGSGTGSQCLSVIEIPSW